jgi:hypothetical protein
MPAPSDVRLLPKRQFAFPTRTNREVKGQYEPNEREPKTLWLSTIARRPNGSPYLIARSYVVTAVLSLEMLGQLGEELDAEALLHETESPS